MQKVSGLYDALKASREKFEKSAPGKLLAKYNRKLDDTLSEAKGEKAVLDAIKTAQSRPLTSPYKKG